MKNKSNRRKSNQFDDISNFIVIVWMFKFFTITFVFFFEILNIVNPDFILLVNANPFVHHGDKVNFIDNRGIFVDDLIQKNRTERFL